MSILHRLSNGFSRVMKDSEGGWDKVIIIGGGPSLTREQIRLCSIAGCRTIAVNDAYLLAPWADVCYFADAKWWKWHTDGIDKVGFGSAEQVKYAFANFKGQKCSIGTSKNSISEPEVHFLRNAHEPNHGLGLSNDPERIVTGWNSGHQAINIAVLAGAKKIILLGFDGRARKQDGKSHWFGDHPTPTSSGSYEHYRKSFSAMEQPLIDAGVRVINCSPETFIDSFEKMNLESALEI